MLTDFYFFAEKLGNFLYRVKEITLFNTLNPSGHYIRYKV